MDLETLLNTFNSEIWALGNSHQNMALYGSYKALQGIFAAIISDGSYIEVPREFDNLAKTRNHFSHYIDTTLEIITVVRIFIYSCFFLIN